MTTIISFSVLSVIFILIDLIPLYKGKQWVSFWVCTSILALGLLLTLLIDLNVEIPTLPHTLKMLEAALGLK